jgi:hypothetical protein
VYFNQDLKFRPLLSLDSVLAIDIRNKPTFDDSTSVGKLTVPLSTIVNSKIITVNIEDGNSGNITVVYSLETTPITDP